MHTIHGFADSNCPTKGITQMNYGYYAKDENDSLLFLQYGVVARKVKNKDGSVEEVPMEGTNNAAEYYAMIQLHEHVCRWAAEQSIPLKDIQLFLYTDSKLLFNQVSDQWKVKGDNLKPLHAKMKTLKATLDYTLNWIERENNALANNLAADEVARDAFNTVEMKENLYRIGEHMQYKPTAVSFPEYEFARTYLSSRLPALKKDLTDELALDDPNPGNTTIILNDMIKEAALVESRIAKPTQEALQIDSRHHEGVKLHQKAGELASNAVLLLEPQYRAAFNGTFISLITSFRKADRDLTAEDLAGLARKSIAHDVKDPQAWLRNYARINNPAHYGEPNALQDGRPEDAGPIQRAFADLNETLRFFLVLAQKEDMDALKNEVTYYFAKLYTDRKVIETVTPDREPFGFTGTFEANSVWEDEK